MVSSSIATCYNVSMEHSQKRKGTLLADFTPLGKDSTLNELSIIDIVVGDGQEVPSGATITAHYTGALCNDGTIFESSHDSGSPATFGLHQVIAGWTKGVPGMKVGGTRRLIIPAALAYGSRGVSSDIGPNSDLVFDIELVSF
jgi:peptidylprolyl isomerase